VILIKPSIFVCSLSEKERESLQAGLRSKDAFVMRRCQILLASSRGQSPPKVARSLGGGSQTVRNAIHAFNERGLDALTPGSSRPKLVHAAFDQESAESLRQILHRCLREFGHESSLWTQLRRITLPRTLVNKLPLLLDTCLQPYYATKITRLGDAPHRPHSYNARSKSACNEGGREDGGTRIE
jgi:transposase